MSYVKLLGKVTEIDKSMVKIRNTRDLQTEFTEKWPGSVSNSVSPGFGFITHELDP